MDKLLKKLYFDKSGPAAFGSKALLLKEARKITDRVTSDDIEWFWRRNKIPSKFSVPKKHFQRAPVIVGSANDTYCGDLSFFYFFPPRKNMGCSTLLVIIDCFSRKIVALNPQKGKSAEETSKNLDSIFTEKPCKRFWTDKGGGVFG